MQSMLSQNAIAAGYNGDITVSAVVNDDGIIAYLTVDASGETEGLGQKVMEPAFLTQFLGKSLPVTLGKDVDGVSGATITSQAVVDALNLLDTEYGNTYDKKTVVNQRSVVSELIYVVPLHGEDDMKMVVKLDPKGTVLSLRIDTKEGSSDIAVADSSFRNQFIGKSLPVELGTDIEAASGSAEASQAVVDVLNKLPR